MVFPSLFSLSLNVYLRLGGELIEVHVLTDFERADSGPCDWCEKPRSEWTNTLKWWGQGRYYCSMECYSAGEYKLNRYLCGLPSIILGLVSILIISLFLTNLTTVTIIAIVTVIIIWLLFSSASLTCVILGRNLRLERKRRAITNG